MAFILSAGADVGKAKVLCMDGFSVSPSGETGEGFVFERQPCQHPGRVPCRLGRGYYQFVWRIDKEFQEV